MPTSLYYPNYIFITHYCRLVVAIVNTTSIMTTHTQHWESLAPQIKTGGPQGYYNPGRN